MILSEKYNSFVNTNREYWSFFQSGCCNDASEEGFEKLYEKAKELEPENAKEFLKSLTPEELDTVRKYQKLADNINIDSLSSEGAANLLSHRYEQIDFNGDGLTEVGAAKTMRLFNMDMPQEFSDAVISALKSMKESGAGENMLFSVVTTLTFRFNTNAIQNTLKMEGSVSVSVAKFDYTLDGLKSMMDELNSPNYMGYIANEALDALNIFYGYFESAWGGAKDASGVKRASSVSDDEIKNIIGKAEETQKRDAEIERFYQELREKGAFGYLAKMNEEKIKEKIEKKKAELMEKYQLTNKEPPLEGKEREKAIEAMLDELETYKKSLYDEMRKKSKFEKEKGATLEQILSA